MIMQDCWTIARSRICCGLAAVRSRRPVLVSAVILLMVAGLWIFGRLFILAYGPAMNPILDLTVVAISSDSEADHDPSRARNLFDGRPALGRLGQAWTSAPTPPPHFVLIEFDRDYPLSSMRIYNRKETRLDALSVRVRGAFGERLVFETRGLTGIDPIEIPPGRQAHPVHPDRRAGQ